MYCTINENATTEIVRNVLGTILMEDKNIEPGSILVLVVTVTSFMMIIIMIPIVGGCWLLFGTQEAYFLGGPHSVQSFITEIAESVERYARRSFLDQDGTDFDLIDFVVPTKVIDEIRDGQ